MSAPSTEPLLKVTGVDIEYLTAAGPSLAVAGLDLTVERGSIVAVVGESGSGKTSLARAILGLLPGNGAVVKGEISLAGLRLDDLPARRLRAVLGREIGFVPQDPMASLDPTQKIGAQVAEPLVIHRVGDRGGHRDDVQRLLEQAGLPDPQRVADSYPHELSGGMRQRVLIAIAFACRPKLIIADEPTSALDATVARTVMDHLSSLVVEAKVGMLLVTHDLGLAAARSDRVVVMRRGEVVESGPTSAVISDPRDPYTADLLGSSLHLSPTPVRGRAEVRARRAPEQAKGEDRSAMVELRSVSKSFAHRGDAVHAVRDVSFLVPRGHTFALVGESGSGKSTTARMLLRLETPSAGSVLLDGEDVTSMRGERLRQLRRRIQAIYQSPLGSLDPRWDVERIVTEPLRAFGVGGRSRHVREAAQLVDRVSLPAAVLHRRPGELSGGQQQRVAIARALALRPDVVICDEPVSALDATVQAQVLDLLTELQDELGLTYLFITHDLAVVREIADQVGVMRAGRLIETGSVADLFAHPTNDYTKALISASYWGSGGVEQIARAGFDHRPAATDT